ncbi:MAG: hypothetical protein AB1393_13075 [Candidatus Edwardsbacteria bacterium]
MRIMILLVIAVFSLGSVSLADTIFLQNGNKIEGKIVGVTSEFVVIQTSEGEIPLRKARIERTEPPLSEFETGAKFQPQAQAIASTPPENKKYPVGAGTVITGGTFSMNYHMETSYSWTEILFAPQVLGFVAPHFALGGDMSFYSNEDVSTIGIGPKMLVAFGSKESRVYPYVGIGVNYLHESDGGYYSRGASAHCLKFGGGINVMLASHLGLPIEIGAVLSAEGGSVVRYNTTLIFATGILGFLY